MRLLASIALAGAAVAPIADAARSADMPGEDFLRGTFVTETVRWEGFHVGGQLGFTNMNGDFSNATRNMVHDMLRESTLENESAPSEWDVLGSTQTRGISYGGFIGYNWQWDSIILGIDGGYTRMSGFDTFVGPRTLQRSIPSSGDNVFIRASSTLTMHDYATLRGRVGYAFGQFMPYAFVGGAVGRFDYATHVRVRVGQSGSAGVYAPAPETQSRDNAFTPGVAAGLGVDIALLPNMFLRGEWEYVAFSQIDGIRASINTARVGLAIRF
jgi:opacity protein-like surface antigen